MSAPSGTSSRKLHQALRELAAAFLETAGFDAHPTPVISKISEGIGRPPRPDVEGVPGVWIDVSARGAHRLSVDLDAAKSTAVDAGFPVTVLVQHRSGRGIAEAYAILTLDDFAKLAGRAPA